MKHLALLCLAAVCMLASCGEARFGKTSERGDTVKLKYATNITIVKYGKYTVVDLLNPWKAGHVLHRYIIVAHKDSMSVGQLPEGTVVYTPVTRAVVSTAPHCFLLGSIGAGKAIQGVCDKQYMKLPFVREGLAKHSIADCGSSMSPTIERIVDLQPQIVMLSPFENSTYGQLGKTGIPIVECADYMETSALGRAEWMKFYGLLFGRESQADSLFNVVDSTYTALKSYAETSTSRPFVLTERKTGNVWYCPGGCSSMAKLIMDAGGRYAFASDKHSGSLSLSPETVIDKAGNADVWMFMYFGENQLSSDDLKTEYGAYNAIKAFRERNVYECNSTATDYFEETSFRPDFLTREFIQIFHPEISKGRQLRYYSRMSH